MDMKTIDKYIAQHGQWKRRLRETIETGQSTITPADLRKDNQCEFGKWLYSLGSEAGEHGRLAKIRRLHAEFHQQAAEIVRLVQAGKADEAAKSMELRGEYAKASSALTVAMMGWKKDLH